MFTKKGICTRNAEVWPADDFGLINYCAFSAIKVMSHTQPVEVAKVKQLRPHTITILRLYDVDLQNKYFNQGRVPPPGEYVAVMSRKITAFGNAVNWSLLTVQIHNEPNHLARYEGWSSAIEDAKRFNTWYLQVLEGFRKAFPFMTFGFPGLAVPHNDLEWLAECREAVLASNWLGCHTYWQNPTIDDQNHLSNDWGLRFKRYHTIIPERNIFILEAGNSNAQSGYALDESRLADEFWHWFTKLKDYDYVGLACPFLLSSPSREWESFTWREESGRYKEVVHRLRYWS